MRKQTFQQQSKLNKPASAMKDFDSSGLRSINDGQESSQGAITFSDFNPSGLSQKMHAHVTKEPRLKVRKSSLCSDDDEDSDSDENADQVRDFQAVTQVQQKNMSAQKSAFAGESSLSVRFAMPEFTAKAFQDEVNTPITQQVISPAAPIADNRSTFSKYARGAQEMMKIPVNQCDSEMDSMSQTSYARSQAAADVIIKIDTNIFRQIDYIWLFTNEITFDQIEGPSKELNENLIPHEVFQEMIKINRRELTLFLKRQDHQDDEEEDNVVQEADDEDMEDSQENKNSNQEKSDQQMQSDDGDDDDDNLDLVQEQSWADENIDEDLSHFLQKYSNGKKLKLDIVAHMEYFYNTRCCGHQTENPFELPEKYQALNYIPSDCSTCSPEKLTLLEKHRNVIFPSLSNSSASKSISPAKGGANKQQQIVVISEESAASDPMQNFTNCCKQAKIVQKYRWYPNRDITSPMSAISVASPSPKKISKFNKRGSIISPNMRGRVVKNMLNTFEKEQRKEGGYDALTPNMAKAPIKSHQTSISALKTQKQKSSANRNRRLTDFSIQPIFQNTNFLDEKNQKD